MEKLSSPGGSPQVGVKIHESYKAHPSPRDGLKQFKIKAVSLGPDGTTLGKLTPVLR